MAMIAPYHVRDRFSRASYRLMDGGRRVFDFQSDMPSLNMNTHSKTEKS